MIVAETFAPLFECLLFWLVVDRNRSKPCITKDMIAILVANLCSFAFGEITQCLKYV
jgi:hypothetical protein